MTKRRLNDAQLLHISYDLRLGQAAFFVRTASRIPVRRPSSTAQRVTSPSGGLLRPRSESYPRQAAFFVRAASRIPVRRPSSTARRVVSPSGGLLRPRGESHPRQAAFFDRAASHIPVRSPSSTAQRVTSPSGRLLRPRRLQVFRRPVRRRTDRFLRTKTGYCLTKI